MLKGDRGAGNFVYKQNWGRRRVCVSALAEDAALLGRGRQGERAGYFLLSSSGSGRRKERGRAGGPCRESCISLCISITLTWRGHGPLPYSPVVGQTPARPPPPPPQPQQQRQPARRSAAQPSPADWKARTQPHSCQCPQEGHGPHVEAGNSSSGSRESCERKCPQGCAWAGGRAAGYSSGDKVCREIPVTRSRTWRRGTVILWPERTERGRYQGGRRPAGPQGGAGRGGETPPVMAGAGTGLGLPSLGTLVLPGPKGTYPPAKEEGSEVWRGFAAQRAGAVLRTEY